MCVPEGLLKDLKKIYFLSLQKRNFKLISLVYYVSLHEKHCKISDEKLRGYIVRVNNGCKLNEQLGLCMGSPSWTLGSLWLPSKFHILCFYVPPCIIMHLSRT